MVNILCLSVFTEGIKDLALNHLTSLRRAGLTTTLSLCPSQSVVDELNALGFRAEKLETQHNIAKEFSFTDIDFNTFSYVRYKVAAGLLREYDYIWYMDVDTVILSNPLRQSIKEKFEKADIFFQDDFGVPCTGCMLVKNTPRALEFLNYMWESRRSETNDQMHLQNMTIDRKLPDVAIFLLSIYEFVPGWAAFHDSFLVKLSGPMQDARKVFLNHVQESRPQPPAFVHANFMVGSDTKRAALKARGLWFI